MMFQNSLLILSVLTALVFAKILPSLQNTSGHEIIDGNCTNITYNERVYYDHVDKSGFPLFVRSETVNYNGSREIYCIQALNQKNNQSGGTSVITDGGVGRTFVTIELESFRGHGLEFYVSIYAKNSSQMVLKPPMIQNPLGF